MESSPVSIGQLASTTKRFAKRLLPIGANRLELLILEMQEASNRLLHLLLMGIALALCGLLGGITLTALVVALFWNVAPNSILLLIIASYSLAGIYLYRRLAASLQRWTAMSATMEQLRKDRIALETFLK